MSDSVDSYADIAIDRWQRTMRADLRGGFAGHHDPRACGCLPCADGRELLNLAPLTPLFARRSWPEVTP